MVGEKRSKTQEEMAESIVMFGGEVVVIASQNKTMSEQPTCWSLFFQQ